MLEISSQFLAFFGGVFITLMFVRIFWAHKNELADNGHRCFGVESKKAQEVLSNIFFYCGLKKRMELSVGGTEQIIFQDGVCLNLLPKDEVEAGNAITICPPNSLPIKLAVDFAVTILKKNGFLAEILPEKVPGLVLIKTDAANGWLLGFREIGRKMPPPEKIKFFGPLSLFLNKVAK